MAKAKRTRAVMMTDDTFNSLKVLALIQNSSVSQILENLGRDYVQAHSAELQNYYRRQISLFDAPADSPKN